MNRQWLSTFLLLVVAFIGLSQFCGDPIHCFTPAFFSGAQENYAENYCWTASTYQMLNTKVIERRLNGTDARTDARSLYLIKIQRSHVWNSAIVAQTHPINDVTSCKNCTFDTVRSTEPLRRNSSYSQCQVGRWRCTAGGHRFAGLRSPLINDAIYPWYTDWHSPITHGTLVSAHHLHF